MAGVQRKVWCCRRGWAFLNQRVNKCVVTIVLSSGSLAVKLPVFWGFCHPTSVTRSWFVGRKVCAAKDPQCSETGIQDKKYLGACGIEPFLFGCSVCLLLKKSEFFPPILNWQGRQTSDL